MCQVVHTQENAHMLETHSPVTTTHTCLETAPCRWTSEDISETCGAQITCKSVPCTFQGYTWYQEAESRCPDLLPVGGVSYTA